MGTKKKGTLVSTLFFWKKSGDIKGIICVDGSKQRREPYYKKEYNASPTVYNGGVMMSCDIDAWERRDVASMDLPEALLQD